MPDKTYIPGRIDPQRSRELRAARLQAVKNSTAIRKAWLDALIRGEKSFFDVVDEIATNPFMKPLRRLSVNTVLTYEGFISNTPKMSLVIEASPLDYKHRKANPSREHKEFGQSVTMGDIANGRPRGFKHPDGTPRNGLLEFVALEYLRRAPNEIRQQQLERCIFSY